MVEVLRSFWGLDFLGYLGDFGGAKVGVLGYNIGGFFRSFMGFGRFGGFLGYFLGSYPKKQGSLGHICGICVFTLCTCININIWVYGPRNSTPGAFVSLPQAVSHRYWA